MWNEQDMGDFQLDLLFNLSGHIDSRTGLRANDMISTQLPIVHPKRTVRSFATLSLSSMPVADVSESSACRAVVLPAGGLNLGRFHRKYHAPMARLHEYQGKAILAANG